MFIPRRYHFFISICILFFISLSDGQRLRYQIYDTINGGSMCFRRLNGTHQMGCSSPRSGAVGPIHVVEDHNDALWIVNNGTAGPYMAVMPINTLFKISLAVLIARPENVAGIIVFNNGTDGPNSYSQESRCPNEYASSEGYCKSNDPNAWNADGTGLMQKDIPFPIYYLPEVRREEVDKLYDCFRRFNAHELDTQVGRPLCAAELNSFMFAAVNSEVCVRRSNTLGDFNPTRVCDALADRNIYMTHYPRVNKTGSTEKNDSVILVTARLDSTSMFDGVYPGAASTVIGLTTLLTAANMLSTILPADTITKYDKNVVWAIFNGESYDYIGSQRVAYDMSRSMWPPAPAPPLRPEAVRLHVEVGQLGGAIAREDGMWKLSAFAPRYGDDGDEIISSFVSSLRLPEPSINVTLHQTDNIPPSSIHSFRRELGLSRKAGGFAELLLVDHDDVRFSNKFYHSVMDEPEKVGYNKYFNLSIGNGSKFINTATLIDQGIMTDGTMQVKVSRLASSLARALYQHITNVSYEGDVAVSAHLVDELLYCYLKSRQCKAFTAVLLPSHDSPDKPAVGNSDSVPANEATTTAAPANMVTVLTELPPPLPLYVGVSVWLGHVTIITAQLLSLMTGEAVSSENRDACTRGNKTGAEYYSYQWMAGWDNLGVCIETTVNYTEALSPAFLIPDYDFASGIYSTWTESVWSDLRARMFVAAGGRGARAAAAAGTFATVLAIVASWFVRRRGSVLLPGSNVAGYEPSDGPSVRVDC